MDIADELYEELTKRFQQLIAVLRWSVELGRIDIMTEVSCVSQRLCSPRDGHLSAVYKVFRYLQNNMSKNLGRIAFVPACVNTYEKVFEGSTRELDGWK